jgi:hypothetical protein
MIGKRALVLTTAPRTAASEITSSISSCGLWHSKQAL